MALDPPNPSPGLSLKRRAFIVGAGGLVGYAATRGLGALSSLHPGPSVAATLRTLVASLDDFQRSQLLFPIDHPSRQVANTISFLNRPQVGVLLSGPQQRLVDRLAPAMLSERGWADMGATFAIEGDTRSAVLAIYGDPARQQAQAVLAGGHYTLRTGGGGALAYGQQLGNGRYRVAGNAFARHGDAANAFLATLSAAQRAGAVLPAAPDELTIQPEVAGARIPGLAVRSLSEPSREAFYALVNEVLRTFAPEARSRIEPASLHFAAYRDHAYYPGKRRPIELDAAERRRLGHPYYQVWRIEGPGVVIHFKGDPHVHAYVQVGDPERPGSTNIGEVIGRVAHTIEGAPMRALHEAALRRATGEALAFQRDGALGRLCTGEVTTGLAWSADPFGNRVAIASIRGDAIAAPLRDRLGRRGTAIAPGDRKLHRIATTDYAATRREEFGEPESVETLDLELREALIDAIREGALEHA